MARGANRRPQGPRGGRRRGQRSSEDSRGRHPRGAKGGRGRPDAEQPPVREPAPYRPPPAAARPASLEPTDRTFRDLNLYPFQARAVDAVAAGNSVLVSAPTGAGKTLVADYAIEVAFSEGWRSVYTAPIKALSNQKFRDFRAEHGDRVGIMTGDVTINPDADLLIMTTEVFRNTLFDEPERLREFRFVVHDEVHFLDDVQRGTVWEESIIHAPPQMRLVALSATVPNVRELAAWIETVRGEKVTVVEMNDRPVPLDHMCWVPDLGPVRRQEAMDVLRKPFRERRVMRRERRPTRLLDWLESQELLPALYFCFSRRECEELAGDNMRRQLLDDAASADVAAQFDHLVGMYACKKTPGLQRLRRMAISGVGYHHAGMLPVYKEIVERLFTSGRVRMLFCTSTFALGINMPARTVAFAGLRKFDGEKMDYMLCREYGQMAGRAGRQGIDEHGLVLSRVDPTKDRPRGVERVLTGKPEPVTSRWDPDYGTLLTLYQRMGERVIETYRKSFAKFQRERRGKGKQGKSTEERVLATRLRVLSRTGHIEDGEVTAKGLFTARVKGYEIPAGEWREHGFLEALDERSLALLLLATVYEPRPQHATDRPSTKGLRRIADRATHLIDEFRETEWEEGLSDMTMRPDFSLSRALELWLDGEPLTKLGEVTTVGEGDLVRSFRLMLQCARQIRRALPDTEQDLVAKVQAVMDAVNRDEVDARRQLDVDGDGAEDAADTPVEVREEPDDAFGAGLD